MKKKFLLFLCLLFCQFSCCQISSKKVYISSSEGDDSNNGSKAHPIKTISHLLEMQNHDLTLYLKRGDIFYESLNDLQNCKIMPYGRGENPIICGFRVLQEPNLWEHLDGNIWRIDLNANEHFDGYQNDRFMRYRHNNIGCIYLPSQDKIYGHLVKEISQLNKDGDFYTTDICDDNEAKRVGIKYLYLYSDTSPLEYRNVCFSVGINGVFNLSNCFLSNISVVGFGMHGITQLDHCVVKNCHIDIIGGAIQFGRSPWVRYGNGIEFWITNKESGFTTISGCVISRTYDCGSTIQGARNDLSRAVNIIFKKNQFVYCRQAFEHFMHCKDSTEKYLNCSFHDKISFMAGENHFNSPELRDADILSYEQMDRTMSITNNLFYGGNYYYGRSKPLGMNNNKVYVYDDQYIQYPHFRDSEGVMTAKDESLIQEYSLRTGDNSKIIVLKRGSSKDLKMQKKLLRKLKFKKPNLRLD